ncbi:hypothetical protein [Actinoplanes utahensis]|uniref:Proteinase inhibitor I42 chagasin domain-containing protein n=1 Tax=Actinoplanes utahensis TaxID=1869 RepID=A0A0A6WWF0_ACTUT|nr:hypothetical protein [Actinoplanes utahensis]KHD72017.1 hypothetical protein MB27_42670 [Actinoplanes utahensis]GIF31627.1 hypothetical protein Aut01nite_46130 [Actinoplanes utahensis]
MRVVVWPVAALLLVGGLGWGGFALYRYETYGTEFTEADLTVEVDAGDRFSLAVLDRGGSVGDGWSAEAGPLLTAQGDRTRYDSLSAYVGEPPAGCCSGTTLFVFDAATAGKTQVTLTNRFQGGHDPSDPENRSVTWEITVR